MKKLLIVLAIVIISIIISGNMLNLNKKSYDTKIYYVDHSMLRLIPTDYKVLSAGNEDACKNIIEKLIEGQDFNKNILRVIPNKKGCIDVDVKGNTAYVNLKKEYLENLSDNNHHKKLSLYSIVNSITSVEGIDCVKFLIDGENKKEYIADIDMREIFIPHY